MDSVTPMNMKLELIIIPVSDVDRAKEFYVRAGFHADHDHRVTPGSVRGMQVVVSDADETRADLEARGIDVSPVEDLPWGRFTYFADPDGNQWAVQQIVG
jgi:predicted enzyme related to lactoylglutathione lyase